MTCSKPSVPAFCVLMAKRTEDFLCCKQKLAGRICALHARTMLFL